MGLHDYFPLPHTNEQGEPTATLNSPIIVGRNHFLKPVLIIINRVSVGHINFSTHTKFLVGN